MLESIQTTKTASDTPPDCIHSWFEAQARRQPDAVAIKCQGARLTYAELNVRANTLAHRLKRSNVGPDVLVALYLGRSVDIVISILAVLKAGGAYLAIEPNNPPARTRFVLSDASPRLVVTEPSLRDSLPSDAIETLCLSTIDWGDPTASDNPVCGVGSENLAYVIYTSGSTGQPKGALITHRNVVRLFRSTASWFCFGANDVWSVFHSFAFDFSVWELWGALHCGGTAVIVPEVIARSPEAFHDLLDQERVTILCQTPSAFYPLVEVDRARASHALKALRFIVFGGEALEFRRLKPWVDRHGEYPQLVNMYGITETTVHTTFYKLVADNISSASIIGVPLPDLQIHLLDENRMPVPRGAIGEIYVGGPGLARGYLNRPDLTAERFVDDPFGSERGSRIYKSGDRARLMPDGQLEFCGRIDDQVKLRGYRIELGEIEAGLNRCAGVAQSVAIQREGPNHEKELVAYVLVQQGGRLSPGVLRAELSEFLPDYMVPSAYVIVDSWPLTQNGKIDRTALPIPRREHRVDLDIASPRTDTEARVAAVWAEALAIDRLGVFDDCFELGGHSLMAARVCTRLRGEFDIALSISDVFSARNVAALAGTVDTLRRAGTGGGGAALQGSPRDRRAPTSFGQDMALYFHELAPGNLAYNNQATIRFRGKLDIATLERTLSEIVRRHESLRTTFVREGGQWRQVIHSPWTVALPVIDEAAGVLQSLFEHRFDPSSLPLVRWTLIRAGSSEHVLVHVEHHLIHDGWSFGVFVREVSTIYAAYRDGSDSPLAELPVQFADFARWQRNTLKGDLLERLLAFWKESMTACTPVLDLPTDRARPAVQTFRGAEVQEDLSPALAAGLRAFARGNGYSLFSVMLAGFFALLRRHTGQDDIVVGAGYANRERRESEALIGMIVNMLPLRVDLADQPPFADLVARVQTISRNALMQQALPFDFIVRSLDLPHDPSRNPLCQVAFSFHDAPVPPISLSGLTGSVEYPHNGSAKFDMNVIVVPHAEQQIGVRETSRDPRITIKWDFNTDLFDLATVRRLFRHYVRLLEVAIAHPDRRISDILMPDHNERRALDDSNHTVSKYPSDQSMSALFEQCAATRPDATAIVCESATVTYGDLNRRANQLASYLRARGVGPEVKVAICVERSIEMVVGLLGILKAGGAYVPLDPDYPHSRLSFMLGDTQAPILLTQSRLRDSLPVFDGLVVCLDIEWASIARESASDPLVKVAPSNLAYVMYTSGSTGLPKGVCIEHRSVIRLVRNTNYVTLGPQEVVLQLASISFDASTFEVWGSLLNGARLVIAGPGVPVLGALASTIREHGITTLWLTAALFHQMVDFDLDALHGVRQVLAGGEALSVAHTRRMLAGLPNGHHLINGYGPTENTTFTCCHVMSAATAIGPSVPIGRPISNTQVYVLDERQRVAPEGTPGELYIGGDGLAREYLNQPDLTAQRFRVIEGRRLYCSGDRARQLGDGTYEFLGRTDDQIKLRGYRIEPGEIESVLIQHPSVRECVVALRTSSAGEQHLAAYLVGRVGGPAPKETLRQFVRGILPEYMVPSEYVALDRIPLTPIGKIDRRSLPDISTAVVEHVAPVLPRNATEQGVAEIWARHLRRTDFGVEDNFFDLGGHSLVAAGIFSEIEARFGAKLPFALLFERPTIAAVARALTVGDYAKPRILIPIQPAGSKPPIFAMLGVGGNYAACATLSKGLGDDQPVFSLEPEFEGEDISHRRIEDIATRLSEEMRAITVDEPYVLLGGCAGALVVFELARRLTADRRPVKLVIMLDPPPTGAKRARRLSSHRIWRKLVLPRFLFSRLHLYVRTLVAREVGVRDFVRQKLSVVREILTKRDVLRQSRLEIQVTRVVEATSAALARYAPRSYAGRVALLLGDRYVPLQRGDTSADWRALCTGPFDVGHVSGKDTGTMLRPPHVQVLIDRLKHLLSND